MAHILISLKGTGIEYVTLAIKFIASAVAQDHALSFERFLVDLDE